jgi:hypothetical protein
VHILIIVCLVLISLGTSLPLFERGYFPMHDDTQVARVVEMGKALRLGQLPVRWVSDLGYGYGYPLFNFYAPLPYYAGGALYAVGINSITATKIMFVLGMLLPVITMYMLVVSIMGIWPAAIAAIFYGYAPYHAVQLYVRGSVGELWANIFIPLIVLGFWKVCSGAGSKRVVIVGTVGLVGAILSHTIYGYICVVLILLGLISYWSLKIIRKNFSWSDFIKPCIILIFSLGISSFFWLPAISEMKYTNVAGQIGGSADFRNHFVCLTQLWDSPWGYGGSAPGCTDGLSFKLGKLAVILACSSIVLLLLQKRKDKDAQFKLFMLILIVLSLVLTLNISESIWNTVPMFTYVQYPWRFLSLISFGLSVLIGGLFTSFTMANRVKFAIGTGVVLVLLFMNVKLFEPQYMYDRSPVQFETETELRYRISKISDEYLPPSVPRPSSPQKLVHDTIQSTETLRVMHTVDAGIYAKFDVETSRVEAIPVYRAYFPGWEYSVDHTTVLPKIIQGFPILTVEPGKHTIEIRFGDTPVRVIGNCISVLSVLLFIWYGRTKKTYVKRGNTGV